MKIYIVCPHNQSGGPRSLHQLGNKLVDRGMEVYMYYGYGGKKFKTNKLLYSDSRTKIAQEIEDKNQNVIIVPETDTSWLNGLHHIRKVIWWLSLNFYLGNDPWWMAKFRTKFLNQPAFFKYLRYIRLKIIRPSINYIHPKELKNIDYHLYNCEYVHNYLEKQGISSTKMKYLCGPIDIDKIEPNENKQDIVLYNPAKASPYILKKVLKYMDQHYPQYKFKALQNMSHEKLLKELYKAKVYLDLGYFPGPERIPREAVMNYCDIVTSTIGAASNDVDIPIPGNFKFDLEKKNISRICELIADMCKNYERYIPYYDDYRKKVISQINNFDKDIDDFVKLIRGK